MTGEPKAAAPPLASKKDNSGQAHPPELPAGQAELGTWPETTPLPFLFSLLPYQLQLEGRP